MPAPGGILGAKFGMGPEEMRCEICLKAGMSGNNVSHSNRHTKTRFKANCSQADLADRWQGPAGKDLHPLPEDSQQTSSCQEVGGHRDLTRVKTTPRGRVESQKSGPNPRTLSRISRMASATDCRGLKMAVPATRMEDPRAHRIPERFRRLLRRHRPRFGLHIRFPRLTGATV